MIKYTVKEYPTVHNINIKEYSDKKAFENPLIKRKVDPKLKHMIDNHNKSLNIDNNIFMGYEGTHLLSNKSGKLSSDFQLGLNSSYYSVYKSSEKENRNDMFYFHYVPEKLPNRLKMDIATRHRNKNKLFNKYDYTILDTITIKNGTTVSINNDTYYRIYLDEKDKEKHYDNNNYNNNDPIQLIWFNFITFTKMNKKKSQKKSKKKSQKVSQKKSKV